jgi:hypothetical protein
MPDTSGPIGTWYLKTWYHNYSHPHRLFSITVNIRAESTHTVGYSGFLLNEQGQRENIDHIRWDYSNRRLVFHRRFYHDIRSEWFNGKIVEGIIVGHFSHDPYANTSPEPRFGTSAYINHFTGWNSNYIDRKNNIVPRVFDVSLDGRYRGVSSSKCYGLLRIDDGPIGRLKIYRTGDYGADEENRSQFPLTCNPGDVHSICGEELEYDLNVTHWDGNTLEFTRTDRRPSQDWEEVFTGTVEGQIISGNFTHTGISGQLTWRGNRAQVLTYGLVQKSSQDRQAWQERTRRQLYHLMMADNPQPIGGGTHSPGTRVRPLTDIIMNRDDNPSAHPQSYELTELFFEYLLPNVYDESSPMLRQSHAWLAVPTTPLPTSGRRRPAAVVVNGHAGSAWLMLQPGLQSNAHVSDPNANLMYYYGDSFARRGFVVLAVDISHRGYIDENLSMPCIPPTRPNPPYGPSPLYGPPRHGIDQWTPLGDDICHSNGPHPFIQVPGYGSSDWEENGERAWDVMHALDYLLNLPFVDVDHVLITGLSLGGEVATIVAALEPRFSMAISAGWSPDTGVFYFNSHGCAHWVYANSREYLDTSDYHALIAPRPLIVQTGKKDHIYSLVNNTFFSDHDAPFAGDKTVARRSRVAYGDDVNRFIHYLHYHGHTYHIGDMAPSISEANYLQDYEQFVRESSVNDAGPDWPQKLTWQTDPSTTTTNNTNRTLFDYIRDFGFRFR